MLAFVALRDGCVQIGTAFRRCAGSGASEAYRSALSSFAANGTDLTDAFTGRLARGIRNPLMNEFRLCGFTELSQAWRRRDHQHRVSARNCPRGFEWRLCGTKAFVIAFSRSLHKEFAEKNIRVQVALPSATATGFFDVAGIPLQQIPGEVLMNAHEMVDAALAGFDQGEFITIPSLPAMADWKAYEAAKENLIAKLSFNSPAARYGVTAETSPR